MIKITNINIKCNSEAQAEAIIAHFNNEHDDDHRYAYLMFDDANNKPELVTITRQSDSINIEII